MFETTRASFLDRLSRHDGATWNEFARNYAPLIQAYGRRAGLQDADIDDLQQAILESLAKTLPRFCYDASRGRFRAYLASTASNAVRRFLSRRSKRSELRLATALAAELPSESSLEEMCMDEWRKHHCRLALRALRRQLDARSLDIFERLLVGRTVEQVCEEFSMERSAIYKVRARVRVRLEEQVRRQMVREDEFFRWA